MGAARAWKGMLTMYEASTRRLHDDLEQCDNLEDLKKILSALQDEREAWRAKINEILRDSGYAERQFAALCEVTHAAVGKWKNGARPNGRDDFIKIGFAARYDLREMNRFLQRYGKFPALYPRSLEDSVYIFTLNSPTCPHEYRYAQEILQGIRERMEQMLDAPAKRMDTGGLRSGLLRLNAPADLRRFVEENAASYCEPYSRLCDYIAFYLERDQRPLSWFCFNASLTKCVSAIKNRKWFPIRRKVIALGIHLDMTVDEINQMLTMAHMETLCPKNPVESAIMYAVTDAELCGKIGAGILCDEVREVMEQLQIPDADRFLNDIQ